ncbi:unnamed protein product [Amoebophrya sp. A120]|nr:unnamed protein product [Amoebophrya sp. A120]|eukprot:GSA120T00000503001.1
MALGTSIGVVNMVPQEYRLLRKCSKPGKNYFLLGCSILLVSPEVQVDGKLLLKKGRRSTAAEATSARTRQQTSLLQKQNQKEAKEQPAYNSPTGGCCAGLFGGANNRVPAVAVDGVISAGGSGVGVGKGLLNAPGAVPPRGTNQNGSRTTTTDIYNLRQLENSFTNPLSDKFFPAGVSKVETSDSNPKRFEVIESKLIVSSRSYSASSGTTRGRGRRSTTSRRTRW